MMLYKYVPPERIDVLKGGLIAFPPPWLFNDPFEGRPVFPADAIEAIALSEEYQPRRAELTAEEEEELQEQIDAIQLSHGLRRIMLEQAAQSVGVLTLSEKRGWPQWAYENEWRVTRWVSKAVKMIKQEFGRRKYPVTQVPKRIRT